MIGSSDHRPRNFVVTLGSTEFLKDVIISLGRTFSPTPLGRRGSAFFLRFSARSSAARAPTRAPWHQVIVKVCKD